MNKEQKKAELLDWYARVITQKIDKGVFIDPDELTLISLHKQIESEPPASKDLPIDEVFGGHCGTRIMRVASAHLNKPIKDIKLSDMPPLSWFKQQKSISNKSLWVYVETMKEHGFDDKLD